MTNLFFLFFLISFSLAGPIKINLVATNDIHGVISPQKAAFMNPLYPPDILGGAAFSKYLDEMRIKAEKNNEGFLLLDGGNFFQGHPLGMLEEGKVMIEWMNRLKYDAIVPGRYDFILGSQNLNTLSGLSEFPYLFSNLECIDCPLIDSNIKPYIIKEVADVQIGIIGVVNSELNKLVLSENLNNLIVKKELDQTNQLVQQMKSEGAEVIILLSSSGVPWNREKEYEDFLNELNEGTINKKSSLNALQMTYFLKDVDFVVAGGNSKGYPLPWYDPHSHTYVMQGYGGGTEFSHLKLLIDSETHLFMGYETVVDGKAGQTLLADDFQSSRKDANWINDKYSEAIDMYYHSKNLQSKISLNTKMLENEQWDIPSINKDNSIEIITWNCEFFPHANDSTILALAEAILDLDAEIIAFQELRYVGHFSTLMQYLPDYNFVVSENASFMDLAIIYKNKQFELIRKIEPFSEKDYNFAGRPPLHIDLNYKSEGKNIPLSIINLHMKCCDSGLERRKKASQMLYDYTDKLYSQISNIIILGDWNDDTKDKPGEHCFDPFFSDERFSFVTKDISYDIKQASYPKEPYVSFLDHIMVSDQIESINNVQTILMGDYMGGYSNYDTYISDHLPVLLSFNVTN